MVDANKRATILSEATFEVTAELDPNDAQMVAVGFQKDKMIAHFASMFNISYQTSGKYYQLANTDTNNWQHCLCIPDDHHVIQGAHGGLVYVYSTQQMSYFVQKKCEQLPGGQAVQQIIKLTNTKIAEQPLQVGKD